MKKIGQEIPALNGQDSATQSVYMVVQMLDLPTVLTAFITLIMMTMKDVSAFQIGMDICVRSTLENVTRCADKEDVNVQGQVAATLALNMRTKVNN